MVLWTANDEHARAAKADGLTVYKGDPTQDATETAPSELDVVATGDRAEVHEGQELIGLPG